MNQKGFTIIELIAVVAIIAILAVAAMPHIFSVTAEAETVSRQGVANYVLTGITLYGLEKMAQTGNEEYPTQLDGLTPGTTCDTTSLCYNAVLKDAVTDNSWKKVDHYHYDYDPGSGVVHYEYDSLNGQFYEM